VHKAVTWANDPAQRAALKAQIKAHHHVLYDNPEGCQAFVAWICQPPTAKVNI
jgi:hypothetical protein